MPSTVGPIGSDSGLSRGGAPGRAPIPKAKLSAERPSAALLEALDKPGMRARAKEIAEKIAREDGVGEAAALLAKAFGNQCGPSILMILPIASPDTPPISAPLP